MDMSYFSAVLKSATFPPYDPWYAGGYLNYYYYGFVFVGVLTKILGIVPAIAYNIIVPMLYSFTGLGAFALAYNLIAMRSATETASVTAETTPKRRYAVYGGLLAILLCVIVGNLAQPFIATTLSGDPYTSHHWFWDASRAISVPDGEVQPITEFPYFTFLYGDLHAHMIALPLTLLALAWVIAFALRPINSSSQSAPWQWLVGAMAIGVLNPTNSWDWPTYLVLGMLGIVLYNLRKFKQPSLPMLMSIGMQMMMLGMLSYMLFMPFSSNFAAGFSELALWDGARTGLANYLAIWGLFLLLIVIHLIRETRAAISLWSVRALEGIEPYLLAIVVSLVVFVGLLLFAFVNGFPIAPLTLMLVVWAGLLSLQSSMPPHRRIVLALISAAFFLTFFVDLFVIEGTVGRMNTVFKFYMQVWVILSVVGGVAFGNILRNRHNWGRLRNGAFDVSLAILLLMALFYAPTATSAKWASRLQWSTTGNAQDIGRTLNGMAFLAQSSYNDEGRDINLSTDYQAIQWMYRNIEGSPVIAEAYADNYYRAAGNRIAMFTGLPTIIGWSGHQGQQRNAVPNARIQERVADVKQLYGTIDQLQALSIIEKYGVKYIYVGALEQAYYDSFGLEKFRAMAATGQLETVYDQDGAIIYKVLSTQLTRLD